MAQLGKIYIVCNTKRPSNIYCVNPIMVTPYPGAVIIPLFLPFFCERIFFKTFFYQRFSFILIKNDKKHDQTL